MVIDNVLDILCVSFVILMKTEMMLLLLPQLPFAGPAAPGCAGCRTTAAGSHGCGLLKALLRPPGSHLQGRLT